MLHAKPLTGHNLGTPTRASQQALRQHQFQHQCYHSFSLRRGCCLRPILTSRSNPPPQPQPQPQPPLCLSSPRGPPGRMERQHLHLLRAATLDERFVRSMKALLKLRLPLLGVQEPLHRLPHLHLRPCRNRCPACERRAPRTRMMRMMMMRMRMMRMRMDSRGWTKRMQDQAMQQNAHAETPKLTA